MDGESDAARKSVWRFHALHAGVPAGLALAVLGVFETTDLDRRIQDLFYDPIAGRFPHRVPWLFETVIRDFGRLSVILLGIGLFAAFLLSYRRAALLPWRRALLYAVLCLAICPVAVAQTKQHTVLQCPRALEIFGGKEPYVRLFDAVPRGIEEGHCWPGGHSSGGFAYGFGLGFGRVVTGSHFVSHNLWAALICWAIALALYELMLRRHAPEAAVVTSRSPVPWLSAPASE